LEAERGETLALIVEPVVPETDEVGGENSMPGTVVDLPACFVGTGGLEPGIEIEELVDGLLGDREAGLVDCVAEVPVAEELEVEDWATETGFDLLPGLFGPAGLGLEIET